jgi:exosortase
MVATATNLALRRVDGEVLPVAAAVLVVLWSGGFAMAYGWRAARQASFALAVLLFMVPIPHAVLGSVVNALRLSSATLVDHLFSLSGTPHYRQGSVLIEIVDECSGIRSSIAVVITSLLAGKLFLRGPLNRALLVAIAVPVAVLKNAIRIVTLSLLALRVNPGFLEGRLHNEGGIVFYLVALIMLLPVIHALQAVESRTSRLAAPSTVS